MVAEARLQHGGMLGPSELGTLLRFQCMESVWGQKAEATGGR